ncbi:MAG: hypothetical protein ABFD98_05735 [Syntrophobacteraceae bacterium]
MKPITFLGIYRERVYSPGKVQDDQAILDAVLEALAASGCSVGSIHAEDLEASMPRAPRVLTMAQSPRVLDILENWGRQGTDVVNSTQSIRNCYRKPLTGILAEAGLPVPPGRIFPLDGAEKAIPLNGSARVWLKRGDVHAIQAGDVAAVSSAEELLDALRHFRDHGVESILVQEHVEGPVVKFYGAGQGAFFRAYLAETGEDISDEVKTLPTVAQHAAAAVGLEVYGGDAVLTGTGGAALIDLNDWPSFSRCCRPAAGSIACYLERKAR